VVSSVQPVRVEGGGLDVFSSVGALCAPSLLCACLRCWPLQGVGAGYLWSLTWKGAPIALVDGVPSLPMSFRCGTHGMVTRFLLCCVSLNFCISRVSRISAGHLSIFVAMPQAVGMLRVLLRCCCPAFAPTVPPPTSPWP
jgi:hypothetical protein